MGDTLLATLPLEDKEITYTIYLYIDSTVSLGNYNDKTYSGYIYATTEQTSTVGKNEDNSKKNLGLQTIDFDYLGSEQQFVVPQTGTYQLETWGASGGNGTDAYIGGYGAYSIGNINIVKNEQVFVNVGGSGVTGKIAPGGYNGGGTSGNQQETGGSGGGATHLSFQSGLLSNLSPKINEILIVSGAGGGGAYYVAENTGVGGNGGGYKGSDGTSTKSEDRKGIGGTQSSGGITQVYYNGFQICRGSFGKGGSYDSGNKISAGGGAGLYGGSFGGDYGAGGGGGSGYIGNSSLTNKAMYCYNCEESTEVSTKTISTTLVSETPVSKYAKKGNGYAKITVIN